MSAQEITAEQRKMALAPTFDRLVASNLQLVTTVRTAIIVVAACAVLSMSWSVYATFAMRDTLLEVRVMLRTVLDRSPR